MIKQMGKVCMRCGKQTECSFSIIIWAEGEGETIIETLCLLQLTDVYFSSLHKEFVKTDNYGNA